MNVINRLPVQDEWASAKTSLVDIRQKRQEMPSQGSVRIQNFCHKLRKLRHIERQKLIKYLMNFL